MKTRSIHKTLYRLLAVQVIIVTIWYSSFVFLTFSQYHRSIENLHANWNAQIMQTIDMSYTVMETVTKLPAMQYFRRQDPDIFSLLSSLSDISDSYQKFYTYHEIDKYFSSVLRMYPQLEYMFVVDNNGTGISISTQRPYNEILLPVDDALFQSAAFEKGRPVLGNAEYLKSPFNSDLFPIVLTRALIEINGYHRIGYIGAVMDGKDLYDVPKSESLYPGMQLTVFQDDGSYLCGDRSEHSYEELMPSISNRNQTFEKDGRLYTCYLDDHTHTMLAISIPLRELWMDFANSNGSFAVMFVLLIAISLLVMLGITRDISRPIKELMRVCHVVEKSDFSARAESKTPIIEMQVLTQSINHMLSEINHLIYEVYEKNLQSNMLELDALKAQINPHFLYNSLESIKMKAVADDNPELEEMIETLARLLRYGLRKNSEKATLNEELTYIRDYITLQNLRAEEPIKLYIHTAPELLDCPVLKMMIQPLVENAIVHGFPESPRVHTIEILAYCSDHDLHIQVSDNGVGMSEDRLEQLLEHISAPEPILDSIGVRNVMKRIQLIYGEEYGIHIASTHTVGTTITILLPL